VTPGALARLAGLVAAWFFGLATLARAQPATENEALQIDLPTALRLADERNLDVAIYLERVAEATARLALARTLAVPTVRIGGSYHRHDGNLQETSGTVVDTERVSRFRGLGAGAVGAGDLQAPGIGVGIDLADAIFQPLVARQNRAAAQAASTANRHQVLVQVAAAYLRLLQSRAETAIAGDALARATDLAALTANYAEAGEGLLADAQMAAVQPLLWEQRRLVAEERTAAATAELARLLHFDVGVRLEPLDEAVPVLEIFGADENLEQLVTRALIGRPETEQLDALLGAAEDDLTAERYGLFIPNVALAYSAGEFGGAPGSSVANMDDRDDLSLLLYWQFDAFGLGNRARIDEKRSRLRQIGLERDKLRDAIVAEVREGYARVQSLRQQAGLAALTVERARDAYTLHRDRIYDQQGLPLEALQAMQTVAAAELAELETAVGYTLAQLRLHTALGNPVDQQP
jgi:outer membrane protein TolC